MADRLQWLWSDGWILMALHLMDRGNGACLHEIIAAADATNHAIPTRDEMSCALTKFAQCGLVEESDGRYRLAAAFRPSIKHAYDRPGGLFAAGDKGTKWLRATDLPAQTTIRVEVSDDQMKAAYNRYAGRST